MQPYLWLLWVGLDPGRHGEGPILWGLYLDKTHGRCAGAEPMGQGMVTPLSAILIPQLGSQLVATVTGTLKVTFELYCQSLHELAT